MEGINLRTLILIYIIFYFSLTFYFDHKILTDLIYFEFYSDKFSESRIFELLDFRKKWLWITYPIKFLFQLIAIQIPAMLIYLGFYLGNYEIKYKKIFEVVLISEFIFFIPLIIKITWFSFHPVSMDAIRLYAPLSLFSIFDSSILKEWLYYPFKVLNLFEVAYWVLLAFLLAKYLNKSIDSMLKIVLGYYVSFLFCWIVFVMFITLGNS
ncbi:MAG: solute carrier family 23 protein [Algoriphagus sp.]|jgi:hypothetical protein|uniref:solute carrier family 23 protein n=1 Tax=Algoriphagus sp. TaxID=1872435 RepID=UPI0027212653|nr:solute carrier family 23 protein [Algoriphagus sp.]MDO8968335.1 solute carrier family 23 protein [Algoriphagus sp.]MDP3200130.1 solute carrier family 23 protein [Algoriphagus sp.]